MNKLLKIGAIFSTLLCFITVKSFAQQQQMYTQYMFNHLAINPAYAGTDKAVNMSVLSRFQWLGIEGAPRTQTFSVHAPFPKRKMGVGLQLINDQVGPISQFGLYGSYAYLVPMEIGTLSAGVQVGFNTYAENLSGLTTTDPNDPAFREGLRDFLPNAGAGLFFNADKWYAGISLPQMINHSVGSDVGNGVSSKLIRHYFISGGYVFDLTTDIKLKPNVLVKVVEGAPIQMDLNVNALFQDVFWAGVSWRSFDSFDLIFEVLLTPQMRLGYAYDWTSTELRDATSGSHEIMLNYRLAFQKDRLLTPRYF